MPKANPVFLVKKITSSSAFERLWSLRLHRPDAFHSTNNRTQSIVNIILDVMASYYESRTEWKGTGLVYEQSRLSEQSKVFYFDIIWTKCCMQGCIQETRSGIWFCRPLFFVYLIYWYRYILLNRNFLLSYTSPKRWGVSCSRVHQIFFRRGCIMMEGLGKNVESPTPQKHGDTGSKKDGMR